MLATTPERLRAYGVSLATRSRRRWYVVGKLLMPLLCLWGLSVLFLFKKGPGIENVLWITLVALLCVNLFSNRGIQRGPIKSFTGEVRAITFYPDLWKLKSRFAPNASVSWRDPHYTPGLDEREILDRNRIHYSAYKILHWILPLAVLFYAGVFYTFRLADRNLLFILTLAFFWTLVIFITNLPHALVLWTEPDVHFDASGPAPNEITVKL